MLGYGFAVFYGGVTLVIVPVIVRMLGVQAQHIVVAVGLGQYRCSSYGEVFAITFYHGAIGHKLVGFKSVAIYYYVFGLWCELRYGSVHGQNRGIQNVDIVYFLCRNLGHCPRHCLTLYDRSQGITLFFGELL